MPPLSVAVFRPWYGGVPTTRGLGVVYVAPRVAVLTYRTALPLPVGARDPPLKQIECIVPRPSISPARAPLRLMVLKEFVERLLIMPAVRRRDLLASLHIPPGRSVGLLYARPARPSTSAALSVPLVAGCRASAAADRAGNPRRCASAVKWRRCCDHRRRRRRCRLTVTNKSTTARRRCLSNQPNSMSSSSHGIRTFLPVA